jgi:plastocyanin
VKRTGAVLLTGVIAGLLLGACGGGGGPAQPSGSIKVTMTEFKFDPSQLDEKSGKVVFFLVNAGTVSHDMVIRRDSDGSVVGRSDLVSAGDSFVFMVDSITAGAYTYFCDQPGHEASGMHGKLTVS